MEGRIGFRIALAVVLTIALIGGAVALGWSAYTMGLAQGAAQTGAQIAPQAGAPYPAPIYAYGPYRLHPFGFSLLGCLGPLLFLFLIFGVFRFLLWGGMGWRHHGGPWGWGHKGPFGPEEFRSHWRERAEEWHRQQHGERPPESSGQSTQAS
jgi:hypothetical protein